MLGALRALRNGPSTSEVGLIRPFRRNSSPFPPLFAIIRPFCAPDHILPAAFRPPFAALSRPLPAPPPAVRPWQAPLNGHIRADPASARAASLCWGGMRPPLVQADP